MRSCFLLGLSLFLMGCTSETPVTTAPGTGGGAAAVVDDSPLSVALQAVNDGSAVLIDVRGDCLLYTSPSPRDKRQSRMPSSA